ncbi:glycosyltransferase [Sphingomonas adhaesiva]|uniref:glycosyltransferase n=1 Tax=Sphingomonas adhaesiva TaxID=28212 RepID=UPI002FF93180
MIRIAFLLPHLHPGGAERVVVNWANALDRDAFAPVVMLGRVEGDFLPLLAPDVPVIAIGGRRALTRPLRIARALAAHRIDLAYAATSAMNLALLAAPTKVPRIVSEHTPPDAFAREAKWPLARRLATAAFTRRAAAVAVPTAAIGEAIRHPRVTVLPNPVLDHAPAPLPAPTHGRRLVAAGRLVPAKGFDTLVDAMALLPDATLTIHGDGPLRADLAHRIAAQRLERRVTLAGHTANLAPALAAADLFVSASRREGFGNVLIEAMALGIPVLATRAGGPETFLRDGINGFLTDPDDAPALARAIAALLADAPRRHGIREAARDTAAGYTVAASTARFAALAQQIAG